jgi:hypothetical protein
MEALSFPKVQELQGAIASHESDKAPRPQQSCERFEQVWIVVDQENFALLWRKHDGAFSSRITASV